MPTYYEILNIKSIATYPEVEAALDVQYNRCRQMITHHDPNVVNQANLALQVLEKMRTTLMDAGKRSAYDAAISQSVVSLADTTLNSLPHNGPLAVSYSTQVGPHYLPLTQAPGLRVWICSKCQSPNTINSQYCKKCGEVLANPCPECNSFVERYSKFCTICGVNTVKSQQKKDLEKELARVQSELNTTKRNAPVLDKNLPELRKSVVINGGWTVVAIVACLTYILSGLPGQLPGINLTGLVMALTGDMNYLSVGMLDIAVAGATLAILVLIVVFLSIVNKISPFNGLGAAIAVLLFISIPKTSQSLLTIAGADISTATMTVLIMTAFIYFLIFTRIFAVIKQNFGRLKLYYKKIPRTGCFLGSLFAAVVFSIPTLYVLYPILFLLGAEKKVNYIVSNYEVYVWYVNAIQFFMLGLVLFGYMVMAWRTSQSIDVQYRQAVSRYSEKTEKLNKQIQSLSQEVAGLDLRS